MRSTWAGGRPHDGFEVLGLSSETKRDVRRIAVLVPCYNEEVTIGEVVRDFKRALPRAIIYVYDNNSTDRTLEVARAAGAVVRSEPNQGKGHVVRRMFADIDADLYVLVDGDSTYEAAAAPKMIELLLEDNLDIVNGVRISAIKEAYRPGHRFGNWLLTALVAWMFGQRTTDMLTGYRVFSRRFVRSFPALTSGFEIETEIIVHALEMRVLMKDYPTAYRERPAGSASKLNTIRDGIRILRTIGILIKEERPFTFFLTVGVLLLIVAIVIFIPVFLEYLQTGAVRRFPTAILSLGIVLSAMLSMTCGLILSTVTLGRREMKRLFYLRYAKPSEPAPGASVDR
jgi:glycosyltransferase involved in cell wall biosynthesis